jgi:hypothetical protein
LFIGNEANKDDQYCSSAKFEPMSIPVIPSSSDWDISRCTSLVIRYNWAHVPSPQFGFTHEIAEHQPIRRPVHCLWWQWGPHLGGRDEALGFGCKLEVGLILRW